MHPDLPSEITAVAAPQETANDKKEQLIAESDLPAEAKATLRKAAPFLNEFVLRGYINLKQHHAFDGHSALDHARMKVNFLPPPNGLPCPDCGEIVWNRKKDELPAWTCHYTGNNEQYARFPIPLRLYAQEEAGMGLWQKLCHRVEVDPFNLAATIIFFLAILHTFLAPKISSYAHHLEKNTRNPCAHASSASNTPSSVCRCPFPPPFCTSWAR